MSNILHGIYLGLFTVCLKLRVNGQPIFLSAKSADRTLKLLRAEWIEPILQPETGGTSEARALSPSRPWSSTTLFGPRRQRSCGQAGAG